MMIAISVACGVLLDFCLGDPSWLPHPVILIGKMIAFLEKNLRRIFPKTPKGEMVAGGIMAAVVPVFFCGISALILYIAFQIHWVLFFVVHTFMCYQMMATKCLKQESMLTYDALKTGDLNDARKAVARIVGRDTAELSQDGVIRAAIESVAESASDGVIAPLFFMIIGGAPLGFFYKSVNTMDSMVGYKNDQYYYYGRIAARLDDVCNFIPARFTGLFLIVSAWLCKYDYKNAWKIFKRDRKNHTSPNSAHPESACAGALQIQLGGSNYYFGMLVVKPTIGDLIRPVEPEDIKRTNRLVYGAAIVGTILFTIISIVLRSIV